MQPKHSRAGTLSLLAAAVTLTIVLMNSVRGPAAEVAEVNRKLGRGVNLGNALEAPNEGDWGIRLEAAFFPAIRQAGFDSVRIPIRWSTHADDKAPFAIQPAFLERVDWAIDQAAAQGLRAVINVHHYEELYADPAAHRERFLALWKQIAERYRSRPDSLVFELLNEPHGKLDDEKWNDLLPAALKVVRATNPGRAVIVGPASWNNAGHLPQLRLPEDDRGLIVTFHYYSPFEFTHQGASWVGEKAPPLGRTWTGSEAEAAALAKDFERAVSWAKEHRRPLYLGEFGAYEKADLDSRIRWAAAVRAEAEKHAIAWAWWEFGAGFGLYDRTAHAWRAPLLRGLVGK